MQFPGVRLEAITDVNEPRVGVVVPIVPFNEPPVELRDVNAPVLGELAPMVVDSMSDPVIKTLNRLVGVAPFTFTMGAKSRTASKIKAAPRAASVFFMGVSYCTIRGVSA
jgi:hypothetical protein